MAIKYRLSRSKSLVFSVYFLFFHGCITSSLPFSQQQNRVVTYVRTQRLCWLGQARLAAQLTCFVFISQPCFLLASNHGYLIFSSITCLSACMYYAAQCVEPGRAILDPTPIPYLPTTQKTLQKNSNLRLLLRRNAYFSSPNIFSSGRANWERKTRSTRTVGSVCPCHVERHWKKITHHCSMRINFLLKKNKIYVVLGLQLSCHFNVENSPQAPNVNHEKKPKLVPH